MHDAIKNVSTFQKKKKWQTAGICDPKTQTLSKTSDFKREADFN